VLTQPGATFASRVAGSLNHHLGFDDLNATSDQSYIETALHYARDLPALRTLRLRVEDARKSGSLFDMAAYARDFEAALTMMFRRFERGLAPEDFEVGA